MVNPLTRFQAEAHPYGNEVDLVWELPVTLPANYKLYIFQRAGSDVSQVNDIDRYFQNIDDLTNYNYNKCFVHDSLDALIPSLGIYQVVNGLAYYFKAVLRDETSGEYSTALAANATPNFEILVNIIDGKEIVDNVLKKLINSITNKEGKKIKQSNEIEVVKAFSFDQVKSDVFVVERVNGSNNQRFWGDAFAKYGNSVVEGDFDVDVIRVTFLTIAGNERRDLIANLMRSRKIFFRQFLKKLGAIDTAINIEGDMYYAPVGGEKAIGFTVIFSLLIASLNKFEIVEVNEHIVTELKVKPNVQTN